MWERQKYTEEKFLYDELLHKQSSYKNPQGSCDLERNFSGNLFSWSSIESSFHPTLIDSSGEPNTEQKDVNSGEKDSNTHHDVDEINVKQLEDHPEDFKDEEDMDKQNAVRQLCLDKHHDDEFNNVLDKVTFGDPQTDDIDGQYVKNL